MKMTGPQVFRILAALAVTLAGLSAPASAQVAGQARPITLAWNPGPAPDVVGYILYQGSTSGEYTSSTNVGNQTMAVVTDLRVGIPRFFAVTAFDRNGYESDFSNEINYTPSEADRLPYLAPLADQVIAEDSVATPLALNLANLGADPSSLVLEVRSSDPTLLPPDGIQLSGTGTNRSLVLRPAANQAGSVTVSLVARSGKASVTNSFRLVVQPVNDPPRLSTFEPQLLYADGSPAGLPFVVEDSDTPWSNLTITVTASAPALFPSQNVVVEGGGADRVLWLMAPTNQAGSAEITVTVSDGGTTSSGTTFHVSVVPANQGETVAVRYPGQGVKLRIANLLGTNGSGSAPLALTELPSTSTQGGTVTQRGGWVFYTPPASLDTPESMPLADAPPADYPGADSFTYTLADTYGGTAKRAVNVYIRSDTEDPRNLALETDEEGNVRLIFSGIPGRTYMLQYAEDPLSHTWQSPSTATADPVGIYEYLNRSPQSLPTRLYRASFNP